ncbi:hypothetical protein [Roseibium sp. RKSG952]|uniref:hypothetical protein n=1 Tax=Roseibium sp. RKSG952 TaxID=2529384 RepID=UPI0018AD2BB8|nr:hypothetical protein [Roseibium sp. RKSG952]
MLTSPEKLNKISSRELVQNVFLLSVLKDVLKKAVAELGSLFAEFQKSTAYRDLVSKNISGAKLTAELKLPKKSVKEVVETAAAIAVGDKSGGRKSAQALIRKHGENVPKELGNVEKMVAEIEKKLKANNALKVPKPAG